MTLLSSIAFGSYLSYTPRPQTKEQLRSKEWMRYLKEESVVGKPPLPASRTLANHLHARLETLPFRDFFGKEVTLVPIPSSSLRSKEGLWVPLNLALALERLGLGKTAELLTRSRPLPKSATSRPQERPTAADHARTLVVDAQLNLDDDLVLVDDVITRGATALGAATQLRRAFPNAKIRVFAMMRTMSDRDEFNSLVDPCIGTVKLQRSGHTQRRP